MEESMILPMIWSSKVLQYNERTRYRVAQLCSQFDRWNGCEDSQPSNVSCGHEHTHYQVMAMTEINTSRNPRDGDAATFFFQTINAEIFHILYCIRKWYGGLLQSPSWALPSQGTMEVNVLLPLPSMDILIWECGIQAIIENHILRTHINYSCKKVCF